MAHRVTIVAASPLVGTGLRSTLADDASLRVDAVARGAGSVVCAGVEAPDVVVAAASDARDAQALLDAFAGRVPLVLLGDALPLARRFDGVDATALGHSHAAALARLPAFASPEQLRAAVQAVLAGLDVALPEATAATPGGAPTHFVDEPPGEPLTPRELEVFELLAKGLSNPDIAAALGISPHTAKFHVGQILAKIGAATRAEAVAIGLKLGLIGV